MVGPWGSTRMRGFWVGGRGSVGGASAWGGVISGGGVPSGRPPPHQHTCEISSHLACAEQRPGRLAYLLPALLLGPVIQPPSRVLRDS